MHAQNSMQISHLCPHLLDILQNHVEVPVKGFDPGKELSVVSAVDKNLHWNSVLATVPSGLIAKVEQRIRASLVVTCELLFTLVVNTLRGPVLKASSSRFSNSSTVGWVAMLGYW